MLRGSTGQTLKDDTICDFNGNTLRDNLQSKYNPGDSGNISVAADTQYNSYQDIYGPPGVSIDHYDMHFDPELPPLTPLNPPQLNSSQWIPKLEHSMITLILLAYMVTRSNNYTLSDSHFQR